MSWSCPLYDPVSGSKKDCKIAIGQGLQRWHVSSHFSQNSPEIPEKKNRLQTLWSIIQVYYLHLTQRINGSTVIKNPSGHAFSKQPALTNIHLHYNPSWWTEKPKTYLSQNLSTFLIEPLAFTLTKPSLRLVSEAIFSGAALSCINVYPHKSSKLIVSGFSLAASLNVISLRSQYLCAGSGLPSSEFTLT